MHNETGEATDLLVGIRAAGLSLEDDGLRTIHLASGASQLVSFPVAVSAGHGRARVQFAASAAQGSDAAELDLPLVEPATAEAFATYGSVIDGTIVRLPVVVPTGVIPQFGGLDLSLSSTALTGLDDAARWLEAYPYRCAEQHASRLDAAAALRSILGEGHDARATSLAADANRELSHLQQRDGGFVFWPESQQTELYTSAWVTFALGEARRAGIDFPAEMFDRGLAFLVDRLRSPLTDLGEDQAWETQAFALSVLARGARGRESEFLARVYAHAQKSYRCSRERGWRPPCVHQTRRTHGEQTCGARSPMVRC